MRELEVLKEITPEVIQEMENYVRYSLADFFPSFWMKDGKNLEPLKEYPKFCRVSCGMDDSRSHIEIYFITNILMFPLKDSSLDMFRELDFYIPIKILDVETKDSSLLELACTLEAERVVVEWKKNIEGYRATILDG